MSIVLTVGNFLNEGRAEAFKLESINKLNNTKAEGGGGTLLDFVMTMLDERYPRKTRGFMDEIKPCVAASKVILSDVEYASVVGFCISS